MGAFGFLAAVGVVRVCTEAISWLFACKARRCDRARLPLDAPAAVPTDHPDRKAVLTPGETAQWLMLTGAHYELDGVHR
jgi:hypothetical protein